MTEEWNENPGDFAREWLRGTQRDETIYEMESRRGKFRLTTTAIEALTARIAQLEAERDAAREALADPNAVHANLLRGDIARPTVHQMIHIYSPAKVRHALENYARNALKDTRHD